MGIVQAELAGNYTQACNYTVPDVQAQCAQAAAQGGFSFTGTYKIVNQLISGNEALVFITGSICDSNGGGCTSNSDPSAGAPDSPADFETAYQQALNANDAFSPVPCLQVNGLWYVNLPS